VHVVVPTQMKAEAVDEMVISQACGV